MAHNAAPLRRANALNAYQVVRNARSLHSLVKRAAQRSCPATLIMIALVRVRRNDCGDHKQPSF